MNPIYRQTAVYMDTPVTIELVGVTDEAAAKNSVSRAFSWFGQVESICSRFDTASELSQLTRQIRIPVKVSPLLFSAIHFAIEVAQASEGAFDPTIGHLLAARGFNRNFRTGDRIRSHSSEGPLPSYRDVQLDEKHREVLLIRDVGLDLGAVAKGMAVDLAAKELAVFPGSMINAGGDICVQGKPSEDGLWKVGIRHPRKTSELIEIISVTDASVCTSGDYERIAPTGEHHIMSPMTGNSVETCASVTVVAPTAMLADALSTAAFVLGPIKGLKFLEPEGVEGMIITSELEKIETPGFGRYHL